MREWLPVVGFEGIYEVSNDGLVKKALAFPVPTGINRVMPALNKRSKYLIQYPKQE